MANFQKITKAIPQGVLKMIPLQIPIRRAFTACVPVYPRYSQLDALRPLEAQLAKSMLPRGTSWVPVWSPPEARYTLPV